MSIFRSYQKKTSSLNHPIIRPTLNFNFVNNNKLSPLITFTRNSQTTYFDKNGILQTAGINQPVFEWDPVTKRCLGLRIWEGVTNFLLYSEDFTTTWIASGATIVANSIAAPSGTVTADKIVETATTGEHRATQVTSMSATTSAVTFSVFVKAAERTSVRLAFSILTNWSGGGGAAAIFDLSNITARVDNSTPIAYGIIPCSNGWFRCYITGIPTTSIVPTCNAFIYNNASSYNGTAGSGLHLFGAQLNFGPLAPYIPTTTSSVSTQADEAFISNTDLTPYFNINEGTLYVEDKSGVSNSQSNYNGTGFTNPGRILPSYRVSNAVRPAYTVNNINYLLFNYSGVSPEIDLRSCMAYKYNNIFSNVNNFIDSNQYAFDAPIPASIPRLTIGSGGSGGSNNYVKRVTYYNRRLTNSQCRSLTR